MTAANRLVRARHDLLTHAHTSPDMSFNNLQKKKFNFKEEEEQVTISVWHRTLPIFAQTAHYAWLSTALLLKASICSNIWHLCDARLFAKKICWNIYKDCEPIQHQWVCNFLRVKKTCFLVCTLRKKKVHRSVWSKKKLADLPRTGANFARLLPHKLSQHLLVGALLRHSLPPVLLLGTAD